MVPVDEGLEQFQQPLSTPLEDEEAFGVPIFHAFKGCSDVLDDKLNGNDNKYFLIKF